MWSRLGSKGFKILYFSSTSLPSKCKLDKLITIFFLWLGIHLNVITIIIMSTTACSGNCAPPRLRGRQLTHCNICSPALFWGGKGGLSAYKTLLCSFISFTVRVKHQNPLQIHAVQSSVLCTRKEEKEDTMKENKELDLMTEALKENVICKKISSINPILWWNTTIQCFFGKKHHNLFS